MNDETQRYHLLHSLRFLIAPEHECSYLPAQRATTLFVDPQVELDNEVYGVLADLGFRRSGEHVYRPHCADCKSCISVRINIDKFTLTRSQRRLMKRNEDLSVSFLDAEFSDEHFLLYKQYMQSRHPGSSMDDNDPEHYIRMMMSNWCDTRLLAIRNHDQLMAVAITDCLRDGLSAVYTYFDPLQPQRGLGIYSILQQVELARAFGLNYVYLGYWIEDCEKMAYKNRFSGLEYFNGHRWASSLSY